MENIKIKKEEFNTNRNQIAKAEAIWDKNFPKDYVNFLLEYNGAIVYPNWPNLGPENKTEIWIVERFFSIGDVMIQKQYPMTYTLHDIDPEEFEEYNLNPENILVFAQGERGVYFLNLAKEDYGHIYIANFSGGDGISKTSAKSFSEFINSLEWPEWSKDEIDPNFEFSNEFRSWLKVFQWHLFYTPQKPDLGLQRFKEVFQYTKETFPREDGYQAISRQYVNDREKLEFLLQNDCSTEGLLLDATNIETIKYLVQELNLDINQAFNDRYPLQRYLSPISTADTKRCYKLIHDLLEEKINLDWSVGGKLNNGELEQPLLEKLEDLNQKYWDYEKSNREWWIKNGRPNSHKPFFRSVLVDKLLGIARE